MVFVLPSAPRPPRMQMGRPPPGPTVPRAPAPAPPPPDWGRFVRPDERPSVEGTEHDPRRGRR